VKLISFQMAISHMANSPAAGEIWTASYGNPMLNEVFKTRPFLVIAPVKSPDFAQPHVTVIPFTSRARAYKYLLEVLPSDSNGLARRSWVACNQLITSKKEYLMERIGSIDVDDWYRVRSFITDYFGYN